MFTPIKWTELTGIDTTKLNDIENALYYLNSGYSKTNWTSSTGITSERLQKIEDAIKAFDDTYTKTTWTDTTRITTGRLQNLNDGLCLALAKKPSITSATADGGSVIVGDTVHMESAHGSATATYTYEIPLNTFNRIKIFFISDYSGNQSDATFTIKAGSVVLFSGFKNYSSTGFVINAENLTGSAIVFEATGYLAGCNEGEAEADIYGLEFYNV